MVLVKTMAVFSITLLCILTIGAAYRISALVESRVGTISVYTMTLLSISLGRGPSFVKGDLQARRLYEFIKMAFSLEIAFLLFLAVMVLFIKL